MSDDLEFRIAKLEMKPGDVLVVKFEQRLSSANAMACQQQMNKILPPGTELMILDGAVDISVLTFDEIHNRITETVPDGARDA